jgi:enoyl-CoA hydratase
MTVKVAYHDSVAVISLDRPGKAHAYHRQMLLQLQAEFQAAALQCPVVVVQSVGAAAFCGGADLGELSHSEPEDALEMLSQQVFSTISEARSVSIAAVHGPAVAGGCELALACDLRIAGPKARFALPETKLGLIPSAGGCTRLAKLVGPTRAKGMILGGTEPDAEMAMAWGLVNRIVDCPREEALRWATSIAERDPVALRLAKLVVDSPSLKLERVSEALLYAKRKK